MLLALIAGMLVFTITILRKKGRKSAILRGFGACVTVFLMQVVLYTAYFMINGVPTT